jgi:hypothetical protein
MNLFNDQPNPRIIDSDRFAQQYRFNLPTKLTQAIGIFTAARLLGYATICHPALLPLLWLPAAVAASVGAITAIRVKDNLRRGENAIGASEANALIGIVLLITIPLVSYQLESRLIQAQSHESSTPANHL